MKRNEAICGKCPIKFKPVSPDGAEKPLLYVVGEAPGANEAEEGRPFVGASGKLLRKLIRKAGFDLKTQVRIYNAVTCRPTSPEGSNRTPTGKEISNCSQYLKEDIRRSKPKLILCVGKSALKAFYPDLFEGGDSPSVFALSRRRDLAFEGVSIRVTYHPAAVLYSGGTSSDTYKNLRADIQRVGKLLLKTDAKNSGLTYEVFEPSQVDLFLARFEDAAEIGFDYEASALNTHLADLECAGIGFARDDTNYAAYFRVKDFWNPHHGLSETVKQKFRDFFRRKTESGCKFIVFNLRYEVPATLCLFDYEFPQAAVIDVMQWCKALSIGGSLKVISQKELYEDHWADDVEKWLDLLETAVRKLKSAPGRMRIEEMILRGMFDDYPAGVEGVLQYLNEERKLRSEGKRRNFKKKGGKAEITDRIKSSPAKLNRIEDSLHKNLSRLVDIAGQFAPRNAAMHCLTYWLLHHLDRRDFEWKEKSEGVVQYTQIPVEIVSKYCAYDSWNTLRLYRKIGDRLRKRRITEAASYYNEQAFLGYELELNGIVWDDERAKGYYQTYSDIALAAIKEFLSLPHVKAVLELKNQDMLNILSSADLDYIKKEYINLNSTDKKSKEILDKLLTSQRLRFALALSELLPTVNSDEKKAQKFFPRLFKWWKIVSGLKGKEALERLNVLRDKVVKVKHEFTDDESEYLTDWRKWKMPNVKDETVDKIYKALTKCMGVSVGDRATWTSEMQALYYFRLYRKALKIRDSFIDGKSGRQCVYVVKQSEVEGVLDHRLAKRRRSYVEPGGAELGPGEVHLYEPKYKVNSAITRRWSSGMHTIPANSEIKNLFVPRFKNGLIAHFDYSQMEVRMLAAISGDKTLIAACEAGGDIHRDVASFLYGIPPAEVNDRQRKASKSGTFAIIYGKDEKNFANEMMNGNLKETRKFFNTFFTRFPMVKPYIDSSHSMWDEKGWVPTIWGDPIVIPLDLRKNKTERSAINAAHRESQNYRIQSSSSNVAAVCLSRIKDHLRERNFRARMYGFTHDSCDLDFPVPELFDLAEIIPAFAEKFPREKWNVPVKIDMEIGVSGGELMGLERIGKNPYVRTEGKFRILEAEFKGEADVAEKVISRLRDSGEFDTVHAEIKKKSEEAISLEELFMPRRAYSLQIGTTVTKVKGHIIIKKRLR